MTVTIKGISVPDMGLTPARGAGQVGSCSGRDAPRGLKPTPTAVSLDPRK
jgi:hypothetical protein